VNASTQLRIIRPIRHDLTEMETWCLVPKGESAEARSLRIRQYEDFFNPTGMAIADDNAVYEECQFGMTAQEQPWLQGHARGLTATQDGSDEFADVIGLKPERSVAGTSQLADETLFQSYYRGWAERMAKVLA
jgi:benzoate/toluate 1,2-dioxygenase alpha subunit